MRKGLTIVGKPVPKVDGPELATGSAVYGYDVKIPNMLHAKILGSPHAHAMIKKIDVSTAESLPGVKKVITFKDVPKVSFNPGFYMVDPKDKFIMNEKVRFVGEPVAVVAAVDEDTAEEALGLIEVEYEVLPAVFDPEEAMKPGGPKIHEAERNLVAHITNEWGDIEAGFKKADYIFENRYTTSRQAHAPIEPHACLATYELGKLTIWSNTQVPFQLRHTLSETLGIPQNRIRVITTYIGGGFGGKHEIIFEPICAILSMKTGKPVKLRLTREEVFYATTTRHPCIVELKTGIKMDGSIAARHVRVILNTGAYASHGPAVAGAMSTREVGLYRSPNFKFEADVVYTNSPIAAAFRGYGNPQQTFAVESQLDDIAEKLAIDPVELRLKNVIQATDIYLWTRSKMKSYGLKECITKAAKTIDWEQKAKDRGRDEIKKRGVGIACLMHNTGAAPFLKEVSSAIVKVNQDGSVQLVSGLVDIGQGISTTAVQIVAEELGVPFKDVVITRPDTEFVPLDRGTYASGTLYIGGEAARRAAADAKQQILTRAAKTMKVKISDLDIKDGYISVKRGLKVKKSVGEVVGEEQIIGRETFAPSENAPTFGAQTVEVEVDTENGEVRILKLVYAHDLGKAINPAIVEGQIEGGAVMGLGYTLTEDFVLDGEGRSINKNFTDYKILHATDIPEIKPIIVESKEPTGPFSAKGVGEPSLVPTAGAIANAIYRATGARVQDLPLTSQKVFMAIKKTHYNKPDGEDIQEALGKDETDIS